MSILILEGMGGRTKRWTCLRIFFLNISYWKFCQSLGVFYYLLNFNIYLIILWIHLLYQEEIKLRSFLWSNKNFSIRSSHLRDYHITVYWSKNLYTASFYSFNNLLGIVTSKKVLLYLSILLLNSISSSWKK